jgi:hypothetical protein
MNPPNHLSSQMSRSHLTDDQLTLLYFDESTDAEPQHLAGCETCRKRFTQLAEFLNALRNVPVPEKGPEWEQRIWARLSPRVMQTLRPARRFQFRPWTLGPALAFLLVAAFFIGRFTKSSPPAALSAQARDRVLLITLGDHLDRSQVVLAELVNAPEGRTLDISGEQQVAGSLVGENRLLRQIVSRNGDRSDTAVLDELERVLVEIAHSPSEVSPHELDGLRQRIESEGLLFKVRVISSNVREKGMKL